MIPNSPRHVSFSLGFAPFGEDLLDLEADSPEDQHAAALRYRDGLLRLYGPILLSLGSAIRLEVVTVDHDLGPYHEVVARVAETHLPALRFAEYLSDNLPGSWADLEEADPVTELP